MGFQRKERTREGEVNFEFFIEKKPEEKPENEKLKKLTLSGQHVKHCVFAEHCWFLATYSLQSSETKPDLAP